MCKGSDHMSAKTKVIDEPKRRIVCRSCGGSRGNNVNGEQYGKLIDDCARYKAGEEKCNFLRDK